MSAPRSLFRAAALLLSALPLTAAADDPFALKPALTSQAVFSCSDLSIVGDARALSTTLTGKGHAVSDGEINVGGTAIVDGDATAGPGKSVQVAGSASVTGRKTSAAAVAPCTPIDLVALATTLRSSNDNGRIPRTARGSDPVSDGADFSLNGGDSLTLPAGTYYFTKFVVNASATLAVSGPVRILCTGSVDIRGDVNTSAGSSAFWLRLWTSGTSFDLNAAANLAAFVYAPNASIDLNGTGSLTGGLFARQVKLQGGVRVVRLADESLPVLTILQPHEGDVLDLSAVLVKGTATDADSTVSVTVNGVPVAVGADGAFGATVDARAVEPPAVTVVATDAVGNVTTRTVSLCATRPALTFDPLSNGNVVATATIDLSGTAAHATSVTVNGLATTLVGDRWTLVGFDLGTEGDHPLTIEAIGSCGRTTLEPKPVVSLDTTKPSVAIDTPANPVLGTPVIAVGGPVVDAHLRSVTVNGKNAALEGGRFSVQEITLQEGPNTLTAVAVDVVGNTSSSSTTVSLDTQAPSVSITSPKEGDVVKTGTIRVEGDVHSLNLRSVTVCRAVAQVVGDHFSLDACPLVEGDNALVAVAEDLAHLSTESQAVHVALDTIAPDVHIADTVATPTSDTLVTVRAVATDAHLRAVSVNGVPAPHKEGDIFEAIDVPLVEGSNRLVARAEDVVDHGTNSVAVPVERDSQPPSVSITAPATDVCLRAGELVTITGTYGDRNPAATRVVELEVRTADGIASTVDAGLDEAKRSWTASAVSLGTAEGLVTVTATAQDSLGQKSRALSSYRLDAGTPTLTLLLDGSPFPGALSGKDPAPGETPVLFGRAVSARALVADGASSAPPVAALTLDGATYTEGTPITSEGTVHRLVATTTDCAGHEASVHASFTVDLTPPRLLTTNPHAGALLGAAPASFSGTSDPDLALARVNGVPALVTAPSFSLAPFAWREGPNTLVVELVDAAGNSSRTNVAFTVKTLPPTLEILESGMPIVAGSVFTREIAPTLRLSDPQATVSASLNGASFASGTPIRTTGDYQLTATVVDAAAHTVDASVSFRVDVDPGPTIAITAPAENAVLAGPTVAVTGTTSFSTRSVRVNGRDAGLSGGTFLLDGLPLESDMPNEIVAVAVDAAGRTATDTRSVTVKGSGPKILILSPAEGTQTNRRKIDVIGAVLGGPGMTKDGAVVVNGRRVNVDATGSFRAIDVDLAEGTNTLTASAIDAQERSGSASVHVTADLTTPAIAFTVGGHALAEGDTLTAPASIHVAVTDNVAPVPAPLVRLNGRDLGLTAASADVPIPDEGGYVVSAVAHDAAGNESRLERSFVVGGGCTLTQVYPEDGASIAGNAVTIHGHCGTALGVTVRVPNPGTNPVTYQEFPAAVAEGTFAAADVPLPADGQNALELVCKDAAGTLKTTQLHILRLSAWGGPVVRITSPAGGLLTKDASVSVAGTVSDSASRVLVNGQLATVTPAGSGGTWQLTTTLAEGPNVLAVRGVDAAGRTGEDRVVVERDATAPRLQITSPSAGANVSPAGAGASVDVTGLVDIEGEPHLSTVVVSTGAGSVTAVLDRSTGSFVARGVPLAASSAPQTITATASDAVGQTGSATVSVNHVSGGPAFRLSQPADGVRVGDGAPIPVSGEAWATPGAQIDVNGTGLDPASVTWEAVPGDTRLHARVSASVSAPAQDGAFGVIGRVVEQGGASASDRRLLYRDTTAPEVREMIPADGAVQVDPNALLLVLFSESPSPASLTSGQGLSLIRLRTGDPVVGTVSVLGSATAFVPGVALVRGESYQLRAGASITDLAGHPLAAARQSTFSVAASVIDAAPSVDPVSAVLCATKLELTGTSVAGATIRVRDEDLTFTGIVGGAGHFSITVPLGRGGFHELHVVALSADGLATSPERTVLFRVDCTAPVVTSATFDRATGRLAVGFSEAMDPSTLTSDAPSASLSLSDGDDASHAPRSAVIAVSAGGQAVTLDLGTAPDVWWRGHPVRLEAGPPAADVKGNALAEYLALFPAGGGGSDLSGAFLSGGVLDDATGRPLSDVQVNLFPSGAVLPGAKATAGEPVETSATNGRGNYQFARDFAAGRYVLVLSRTGYTRVVRRLPLEPATGAVAFDGRLTPLAAIAGKLTPAGGTFAGPVGSGLALDASSGAVSADVDLQLTALSGQGLPELLPLGYTPLAAAHVRLANGPVELPEGMAAPFEAGSVRLTLPLPAGADPSATLLGVRYDPASGLWMTLDAPDRRTGPYGEPLARLTLVGPGTVAVVVADSDPATAPPAIASGANVALAGAALPQVLPALVGGITLDPPIVAPSGRSKARVIARSVDGTTPWPSGLAVQAYLDEKLVLAEGGELYEAPFTADLVLYHLPLTSDERGTATPAASGAMTLEVSPSPRAAQVLLQSGFDNIRLYPFPEQIERGSVLGPAGGSVLSPDGTELVLSEGALAQRTIVKTTRLTSAELAALSAIEGWDVVAGVRVDLGGASLARPATLKVPVPDGLAPDASGDPRFALAGFVEQPADGRGAFARVIERASRTGAPERIVAAPEPTGSSLPLEGLVHEGLFLVLHARAPIAYAYGLVTAENGYGMGGARVTAAGLGTAELSVPGGAYAAVIPAGTATLTALHPTRDERGTAALSNVVMGTLVPANIVIRAIPPSLIGLQPADGSIDQPIGSQIVAHFSEPLDAASVSSGTIDVQLAGPDGTASGAFFTGKVALTDPATVTFTPSYPLPAGRLIICRFIGGVRDAGGTPYQAGVVTWSFTTSTRLVTGGQVHPELFHLEVPVDGRAKITADAGAVPFVPAGSTPWAVWAEIEGPLDPVKDTVAPAPDGSVLYTLGHPPDFAVTIASRVIVHVADPSGNDNAFRLGPFVTADHLGFVAPPGEEIVFTSAEGIQVTSPAGAFAKPTLVRVTTLDKTTTGVSPNPGIEIGAYVNVDFDGTANEPLRLKLPVSTSAPIGSIVFVGTPTQTPWGTRFSLVDLGSVIDGGDGQKLLSTAEADQPGDVTAQLRNLAKGRTGPLGVPKRLLRSILLELTARQSAAFLYGATVTLGGLVGSFTQPMGWQFSFLYNTYADSVVYVPWAQDWDGHFILPVIIGSPLQLVARDPATGWILSSTSYDPMTSGGNTLTDVGSVPTGENVHRPRLVDAKPLQLVRFPIEQPRTDESCLRITFEAKACAVPSGLITLKPASDDPTDIPLAPNTRLDFYRLREDSGQHAGPITVDRDSQWTSVGPLGPTNAPIDAPAEEALLVIGRGDLDSNTLSQFTFVFDRAIDKIEQKLLDCPTPDDCLFLLKDVTVPTIPGTQLSSNVKLPIQVSQSSDRTTLTVTLQGTLPQGHSFNLSIPSDPAVPNGDKLSNVLVSDGSQPPKRHYYLPQAPHEFLFATRPATDTNAGTIGLPNQMDGVLGDTNIAHDFVKTGGLLIAGSATGAVVAFDISDIAARPAPKSTSRLFAVMTEDTQDVRAMAADRHNRVFVNTLTGSIWGTKALRVEDVRKASSSAACASSPSWKAGVPCFKPMIGTVRTAYANVSGLTATEYLVYAGSFPYGMPVRMELLESDETNPPRKEHLEDGSPDLLSVDEFVKRYGDYGPNETPTFANGFFTLKLDVESTHGRRPGLSFRPAYEVCTGEYAWDHFQRVTIDDVTTGQSWSYDIHNVWPAPDFHSPEDGDDVRYTGHRKIPESEGIKVRAGDQLRIRFSLRTLGYIAILGSGITVVDLNRSYRTVTPANIATAQKGQQCGRRLDRFEGQDVALGTCPSDGFPPAPGTGLTRSASLAIAPDPGPGVVVDANGVEVVDGIVEVLSPLEWFGGAHTQHLYGERFNVLGPTSGPPITFNLVETACMRPKNSLREKLGITSVTFRDVAIARGAKWYDRGIRDKGDWDFSGPLGGARLAKGDLAFFSLGDAGILSFNLRGGSIAGPAIGRYRRKDHLVYHLAISDDGKKLLAGGTDFTKSPTEPFIDIWDISRVNGGPTPATTGPNGQVIVPESDPRLLASIKAPWATNHVYLDETGDGLLYTWGQDEIGGRAVPVADPQFVFNGVYRSRIEPDQGQPVKPVLKLATRFMPLGVPGRVAASDDLDPIKQKEVDREVSAAFRLRVSLPGNFGDTLVAKVQSLRSLPSEKRLLARENVGPAVALPGGPGWPRPEIYVTLKRLGNADAHSATDASGASGKLSVAWQEYESDDVIVLVADPRARSKYIRQDLGGEQIADEKNQCRRCNRPEHYASLKKLFSLKDENFRELLAGGRFVRAILSVPPPPPSEPDPDNPIPPDKDGATQKALDFFRRFMNASQDNYLPPTGVIEVMGWADEVPSPVQVSLKEPPLNPAFLPIEAGVGVHLSSGDATLETTDHFAAGRSIGFVMDRGWRSGMLGYGPLGSAPFTSSLFAHVRRIPAIEKTNDDGTPTTVVLSPETVELHDGNGAVYRFYPFCMGENCPPGYADPPQPPPGKPRESRRCPEGYEPDEAFCTPRGLYVRLQADTARGQGLKLLGRNHESLRFDSGGTLVKIADRHHQGPDKGSTLDLVHDPFGQLVLAQDDIGRKYRFQYQEDPQKVADPNPYGTLKKLKDAFDRELKYEFDKSRRLTKVIYPKVELHGGGDAPSGDVTPELTYHYVEDQVLSLRSPLHDPDFATTKLRSWKLPEYQGRGDFRLGFHYSDSGQLDRIEYPSGNPWQFRYTSGPKDPVIEAHSVTPFSLDTTYALKDGRLDTRSELVECSSDTSDPTERLLETKVEYKEDGRISSVLGPEGTRAVSKYQDDMDPPPSDDRLAKSNVRQSYVVAGDNGGAYKGYQAIVTSAGYQEDNLVDRATDGEKREIEIGVAGPGKERVESAFVAERVKAWSDFDPFGRAKVVRGGEGEDETVTGADFYEDKAGRKDAGLLKKLKVGDDAEKDKQITEEYERDERGNVTEVKRSDHSGSKTDLDEWDRPWQLTLGTSDSGAVQSVEALITIGYDAAGHVTTVKRKQKGLGEGSSQADVVTTYSYDERERVTSVKQTLVSGVTPGSFDTREETIHFDDRGLLDRRSVKGGVVTAFDYDAAGRVSGITHGTSGKRMVGYDELGRVAFLTDGDVDAQRGVWRGKYDGWGRLYKETYPNDAVARRQFDMAGGLKLETVTGANDEELSKLENVAVTSFGALKDVDFVQGASTGSLALRREFDSNGRLKTQKSNDRLDAGVKYRKSLGLVDEVSASSGKTTLRYPDKSAWPDSIVGQEVGSGCGGLIASVTTNIEKRDALGRVLERSSSDGTTATFEWDEPGNLLSFTDGRSTLQMGWDSDGSVTRLARSEGIGTTAFGYDPEGRIRNEVMQTATGAFRTEYVYDENGRVKQVNHPDHSSEVYSAYYPDDMVRTLTTRSGAKIEYSYDKANNLVSQSPTSSGSDVDDGGRSLHYDGGSRLSSAQRLLKGTNEPDHATEVVFSEYDGAGRPKHEKVGARDFLTRTWEPFGREREVTLPAMFDETNSPLKFTKAYEPCSDRLLSITSERLAGALGARWAWAGGSRVLGITTNSALGIAHRYGYIGGPGAQPPGDAKQTMQLGTLTFGSAPNDASGSAILGTSGTTAWAQLAYGYRDGDGARLGRLVMGSGVAGLTAPGLLINQGFSYGLDPSRRLTRTTAGVGSLTGQDFAEALRKFQYFFDPADHLESIITGPTAPTTVKFDRGPLGRTEGRTDQNGSFTYKYDAAGRRTEDDRFIYRWYWYGKLAMATVKSGWRSPYEGHQIRFIWDALGRLLAREHVGALPEGVTDDSTRPFIEKREYVWDDKGLVRETAFDADGQIRWRKSWTPGARNLADQVQLLVEKFSNGAKTGEALYAYLFDENGTVLGVIDESSPDLARPRAPMRWLYSAFGEAHVETGPETRYGRYDDSITSISGSSGPINQDVTDPANYVPGAVLVGFSEPIDVTTDSGFVVDKCQANGSCTPLPEAQRAIGRRASTSEETIVLPLEGWQRGITYRIRLVGLKDEAGRPISTAPKLEFVVPLPPDSGEFGSGAGLVFDRTFEIQYESYAAAGESAGGEIPGGQPLLFQHAWTDPVLGIALHGERWYCPRDAVWLSEDPMGPVDSPNLYAFVGQRPHEFTDPLGQQLQKFRTLRGERYSAAALRKQGWRVFWGGADHRWNAPGADAFAYNKELDQLAFFDDKNVFRKTVREASSLTNLEAGPSMEAARKAIRQSEMSQELQDDLLNRLEEGKYKKYVTAAAPESRAGRVSEDLAKQGVDFLETKVKPPRMNPGSAGIARKIGKALPYVRLALIIGTLATADSKIEAAVSLLDPTGGALNSNSVVTQEEENRGMKEDLILQQLGEDQWLRDTSNLFAPSHQPPAPAPMQKSHEPPPPTLTIGPLL